MKTKIETFEESVIKNGIRKEDYPAYEALLKRVRGNYSRLQHVYTTAVSMKKKHWEQAVDLIDFGLSRFPDSPYSTYAAQKSKGIILERAGKYTEAYHAFSEARKNVADEPGYLPEISVNLIWALMHKDCFACSDELKQYRDEIAAADEFFLSFVNVAFRISVSDVIIALGEGNKEKADEKRKEAFLMTKPSYRGRLQSTLKQHDYKEKLRVTKECKRFLKTPVIALTERK